MAEVLPIEITGSGLNCWTAARNPGRSIWFGNPDSPGGRTTLRGCTGFGKPVYLVIEGLTQPADVVAWIEAEEARMLNVAGNRGSASRALASRSSGS